MSLRQEFHFIKFGKDFIPVIRRALTQIAFMDATPSTDQIARGKDLQMWLRFMQDNPNQVFTLDFEDMLYFGFDLEVRDAG